MRRALSRLSLLAVLVFAAPLHAADEPKKEEPKKEDAVKLVRIGQLVGTVQAFGGSSQNLTVRVPVRYLEPNPQAQATLARQQQEWVRRQQQIMTIRNPWQRQQQLAQLIQEAQQQALQAERDMFRVKETHQDVELEPADDVKVRVPQPLEAFDDKGNVKVYTPQELKELRGKDKLPGYPADLSNVQTGQTVYVVVARKKLPKDADKEMKENAKPVATLILILAEKK